MGKTATFYGFPTIGYAGYVSVAFGHAFTLMLRRSRLILATIIALLPVLIPPALVFLTRVEYVLEGGDAFVNIMENLYLSVLAPVLALFFATMLVGDDVESQTIAYMLTRPVPRSSWVIGRYLAFAVLCGGMLFLSAVLTFAGCMALPNFTPNTERLLLFAQYAGLLLLSVISYGGLCLFMGAWFKRPIIYGVVFIFGWQRLAMLIPGLVDFLTLSKYLETLYPALAEVRARQDAMTQGGGATTFVKTEVVVADVYALATLLLATMVFIALAVYAVRKREFSMTAAAGG